MTEPAVIVEKDGAVLTVTLNRPEKRNAINCESMCRLYDAWVQLDQDDDLRVAILTGKGNTFCAGMDLAEIAKMSAPTPESQFRSTAKTSGRVPYRSSSGSAPARSSSCRRSSSLKSKALQTLAVLIVISPAPAA